MTDWSVTKGDPLSVTFRSTGDDRVVRLHVGNFTLVLPALEAHKLGSALHAASGIDTADIGGTATCPDCGNPVRFCDCPDRQVDKRDSVTDGPTVERSDHARWVKGDKVAGSGRLPDYVDRAGVVTEVVSAIPDLVGYYVLWDGETGRRGPYDPVELADPE